MGDASFFAGLRNYTRRAWRSSATTEALRNAMEETSGEDLAPLFAEWGAVASSGPGPNP